MRSPTCFKILPILILIAGQLAGCRTADPNPPAGSTSSNSDSLTPAPLNRSSLVGRWHWDSPDQIAEYMEDGTASWSGPGQPYWGTWNLEGRQFVITYPGGSNSFKILQLTQTTLKLEQVSDGAVYTGVRVTSQDSPEPTADPAPTGAVRYVGKWRNAAGTTLEFRIDGTFTCAGPTGGGYSGQWKVEGAEVICGAPTLDRGLQGRCSFQPDGRTLTYSPEGNGAGFVFHRAG